MFRIRNVILSVITIAALVAVPLPAQAADGQAVIMNGPAQFTNSTLAEFGLFAAIGGVADPTNRCTYDTTVVSCVNALMGVPAGTHTFVYELYDGTTFIDSDEWVWTVDLVAPDTFIVPPTTDPTSAAAPGLAIEGTDDLSPIASYECAVNSGAWGVCPTTFHEGVVTLEARATDAAGNVDSTPATATFTVDTVAPETIGSLVENSANSLTATFSGSDSGSGIDHVECTTTVTYAGSGSGYGCISPENYSLLPEDVEVVLYATAYDNAGNYDPTPLALTYVRDTHAPIVTIGSAPAPVETTATASFQFSADDTFGLLAGSGVDHFECSIDGAARASCITGMSVTGLAEGTHDFAVWAIDAKGNESLPATAEWTVDTIPPTTQLIEHPAAFESRTSGEFTWQVTGGPATSECSLDDAAFAACTSPFAYSGLGEGGHSFTVRSSDLSGNTETTGAVWNWTVDTIAPETAFTATPSAVSGADVTFEFGTVAPAASFAAATPETYQCSLDGAAFAACESPVALSGLGAGIHTFAVAAVDEAGNVDPTPASYSWLVASPAAAALAATGSSVPGGIAASAALLLLVGAALMIARRRRSA